MRTLFSLFVILATAALLASAQSGNPPMSRAGNHPAAQAARQLDMDSTMPPPPVLIIRPRVDPAKVKSEADEIARLAQSVPAQITQAAHGVLPKDLGPNLKQIEKLTKQLRRELNL